MKFKIIRACLRDIGNLDFVTNFSFSQTGAADPEGSVQPAAMSM